MTLSCRDTDKCGFCYLKTGGSSTGPAPGPVDSFGFPCFLRFLYAQLMLVFSLKNVMLISIIYILKHISVPLKFHVSVLSRNSSKVLQSARIASLDVFDPLHSLFTSY